MRKFLFSLTLIFSMCLSSIADENTEKLFKSGIMDYKNGNYIGCMQSMEEVTAIDPGNALAHYYLAISYVQINKPDDAISEYQIVESLSPDSKIANYAKLGISYIDPGFISAGKITTDIKNSVKEKENHISKNAKEFITNQQLKNVMNEANIKKDVEPSVLKKFEDYTPSKVKQENKSSIPSQNEINKAMQTLSKAGMTAYNPQSMEMNMMMSMMGNNNNQQMMMNPMMMNMMMQNPQNNKNVSPQIMQQMYMNMMMPNMDFSSKKD